jgi:deoxyribonuclease V
VDEKTGEHMNYQKLHSWDLTAKEAVQVQAELQKLIELRDDFDQVRVVAGADVAFKKNENRGFAAVIVYSLPDLKEIERKGVSADVPFPYVPGLLAFREAPILLEVFSLLTTEPDIVMFDGQGIAHFRRMGIATHLGILLGKPTIGCAKSRLIGTYQEPGVEAGCFSSLLDRQETIGGVVRTRRNVHPVFVSPGHKISLRTSIEIVLKCCDGYRIPKPTRMADRYAALLKKEIGVSSSAKLKGSGPF